MRLGKYSILCIVLIISLSLSVSGQCASEGEVCFDSSDCCDSSNTCDFDPSFNEDVCTASSGGSNPAPPPSGPDCPITAAGCYAFQENSPRSPINAFEFDRYVDGDLCHKDPNCNCPQGSTESASVFVDGDLDQSACECVNGASWGPNGGCCGDDYSTRGGLIIQRNPNINNPTQLINDPQYPNANQDDCGLISGSHLCRLETSFNYQGHTGYDSSRWLSATGNEGKIENIPCANGGAGAEFLAIPNTWRECTSSGWVEQAASHGFVCQNHDVRECCGNSGCLNPTNNGVATGISFDIGSIQYCTSSALFDTDLDAHDQQSCESAQIPDGNGGHVLAGYIWTGNYCCSEADDPAEFYNDNGGRGGCWNSAFVQGGDFAPGSTDSVFNYNGNFLGCIYDNNINTGVNYNTANDAFLGFIDNQNGGPVVSNQPYCAKDPNNDVFCSFSERWIDLPPGEVRDDLKDIVSSITKQQATNQEIIDIAGIIPFQILTPSQISALGSHFGANPTLPLIFIPGSYVAWALKLGDEIPATDDNDGLLSIATSHGYDFDYNSNQYVKTTVNGLSNTEIFTQLGLSVYADNSHAIWWDGTLTGPQVSQLQGHFQSNPLPLRFLLGSYVAWALSLGNVPPDSINGLRQVAYTNGYGYETISDQYAHVDYFSLEKECCGATQCWDGFTCVDDQSADPTSAPTGPNQERCLAGSWSTSTLKYTPDFTASGYCTSDTQCLLDPNPAAVQQCVDDGFYLGDDYCDGGVWTTRTKLVATELLNYGGSDFVLFCDEEPTTLNFLNYIFQTGTADSALVDLDTNKFCILQTPSNTFGATSYNADPSAAELSIFGSDCSSAFVGDGNYNACSPSKVIVNDQLKTVIFSSNSVSYSGATALFLQFISDPLQTIVDIINTIVNPSSPELNQIYLEKLQKTKRIYIAEKSGKSVRAAITQSASSTPEFRLVAEYAGFSTDICSFVDSYAQSKNLIIGDQVACSVNNNDQYVYVKGSNLVNVNPDEIWPDLTSKLRIQ